MMMRDARKIQVKLRAGATRISIRREKEIGKGRTRHEVGEDGQEKERLRDNPDDSSELDRRVINAVGEEGVEHNEFTEDKVTRGLSSRCDERGPSGRRPELWAERQNRPTERYGRFNSLQRRIRKIVHTSFLQPPQPKDR
jgi:hypothetical protein